MGHARKERVLLFGTDQRITSGPAAKRPHSKAEYMTAPERFADMSDSSCTAGAVHTWPITSLTAMQQFFRSWGHSGHDTSTVARGGPPRASPSSGRRTHPEIGQKLHRPAKGGNGEASAKSRRVNQFSVFVFGLPHSPAPREGFWKGFNFSLSFFWSTRFGAQE